jgi:hypothetical protein
MPNIQPLLGTLHLHSSTFFFPHVGTNPNLMVFNKSIVGMDTLHDANEEPLLYFIFYGTFQSQNKTKLNAQNNLSLGMCQVGDILVVVHSNFSFKFSMTTLLLIGSFGW